MLMQALHEADHQASNHQHGLFSPDDTDMCYSCHMHYSVFSSTKRFLIDTLMQAKLPGTFCHSSWRWRPGGPPFFPVIRSILLFMRLHKRHPFANLQKHRDWVGCCCYFLP
ncbi:hypothetical protein MPTK1_3g20750 [Marchantia polymorpha subsp. ruderalis]|uniref:Uncharacterized protein n=2 Tax=Marchantia polymorpha TaxID=3197 RepID=A0AAF6B309_MARPO|nr:hypothetical protein MARPO_0159s0004 [Marchantia polymorpha]BBN06393.1 hypothetical protein Mp_3g20750 [Marchantia polymorpha subsp. ruderalis]|eukprot:PTQ28587.1 hypothetical protein MARPO_0159s0004 [Marchantia polymorpha]